jgi:hypothetical protein
MQGGLTVERERLTMQELKVAVGDRVIISRPISNRPFAAIIERIATVTAVRPRSFDAGGLCFRNDGKEWGGHSLVRPISQVEQELSVGALAEVAEASRLERAERAREDVLLAFLLSSRHEEQWLKLGLEELRRIAALHGISSAHSRAAQPAEAGGDD